MTVAHDAERVPVANLGQAVDVLRARGMRISTSRRLVLEALFDNQEPASAEQLARRLELELTSVYRNLELLERLGLVRHLHLGHSAGLYALVGREERDYLYCERCGSVRGLAPEEFEPIRSRIRELWGHDVRFTHFALAGTCAGCGAPGSAGHHHP